MKIAKQSIVKYHRVLQSLKHLFYLLLISLFKTFKNLGITSIGIVLIIGLVLSWIKGLSGGYVLIWICVCILD